MPGSLKIDEGSAQDRITSDEQQYMQVQLAKGVEDAHQELSQYKTEIMVERRDANFVFLKDKTKQMETALATCGDQNAINALEQYKNRFGMTEYTTIGRARVRSYQIALYQALLFAKADPIDQEKLLGDTGPCGCGVDGIYGLQTLLTSAAVFKGIDPNFHGVVNGTTFAVLTMNQPVVIAKKQDHNADGGDGNDVLGTGNGDTRVETGVSIPELLKVSFPGSNIEKSTAMQETDGNQPIFDANGNKSTLEIRDKSFVTTMQDWKVTSGGKSFTLMSHDDVWYIRDSGKTADDAGYRPVKMKDNKIVMEVEEPNEQIEEPNEQIEEPNEQIEEPNEQIEEPNEQIEEPNEQIEEPNEQIEEPNEQIEEIKLGTVEKTNVLREVADLTRRASELVTTGNGLRDAGDTAGALGKYNDAVELYRQALQKVETHNQTYPQNTIENSEIVGWKSGLEGDIQRYKEEIGQQQRQKETEQQARGQRLDELQRQIQEEGLVVTIDNTITPENVTEAHLTGIEEYIKTARAQKQELDNRAAEEKKHSERVERASDAQFGGLVSYDRSGEVFKVNIAYGIRNIVARDINSLSELQTRVQSEAQRVYTDIFSSTVSGKKQTLSTEVATDRQLTLNRESNKNIQSFDAGFAARKKRETVDHASVVDEMTKYNLLGAGFLEGDINTYTGLIQDATNYTEQMITIDTEIDQQAQKMLAGTTEIVYDAENNSFTVKGVTLPRAEVMGATSSVEDIVDRVNEQLTEGTSVSYDAKNNIFTYKGARKPSAAIQSVDELSTWVKEVGMQITQQRNKLDLAEGSYDMRGIQTQITGLNLYISNPEDGFKLVDRKAEQQSSKKKKKNDPPHIPEREVSYTSLLTPHSVPLKEYITVDGIVDVPGLQKKIRGHIESVYKTTPEVEKTRLLNIYKAIGGLETDLVNK